MLGFDVNSVRTIYFAQGIDGGPIKIGIAHNPEKRVASLEAGSPVRLRILATRPGNGWDERWLLSFLRDHRLHSEWFEDCDEVREFVGGAPVGGRWGMRDGQYVAIRVSQKQLALRISEVAA